MEMIEASSLRRKLRAKVCCCFGPGVAGRARWRRRAAGEFRYDPLSYALNFDEGDDDDAAYSEELLYRSFSSRLPPSPPPRPQAPTPAAIEIA